MVKKRKYTRKPKIQEQPESLPEEKLFEETQEETSKEPLENVAKAAGFDLGAILKFAEPLISQAVAKTLQEMKLTETLTTAIDKAVKQKTDAIEAQVTAAIAHFTQQPAPAPTLGPTAPQGGGISDTLIAAIAQNVLGGGGGGIKGLKEMFEGMKGFMDMTASLYQIPRLNAQKEIIDIMKAGYAIGLETKQVIEGAEKGLAGLTKPTA